MIKYIGFSLLLFLVITNSAMSQVKLANEQIKYPPPKAKGNKSHDYFVSLLKLALDKTRLEYGTTDVVASIPMGQARSEIELERGLYVDVVSFGSSIEREDKFLAIKIPIYRGILGFRMSIIRKGFEKEFSKITTIDDLKKYSACQGESWPDTIILEQSGLKVIKNPTFKSLFRQVVAKRCDYFPRSVQEGPIEIALMAKKHPELMLYRGLIIYYPYSAYFFVNKSNISLHHRLFTGISKAINDGSFQNLLQSHISTRDVFPIEKWINVPTIELINPLLSKGTDINNSRYWIKPHHKQPVEYNNNNINKE